MNSLDRDLGFFPMSIGTSLAFEGLFHLGEHLDDSGDPAGGDMPALWVNLRTVVRNARTAFPRDGQGDLLNKTLKEAIDQDLEAIRSVVDEYSPNTELKFYITEHKTINSQFKDARFKVPTTADQNLAFALESAALIHLHEDFEDNDDCLIFDWKLEGKKETTLLTHHALDLLSYYEFPDMRLLESHTGRVKTRKDWYTKLNTPKGTTCIPFTRAMLLMFGDGSNILAQELKPRRTLITLGEKYKWNGMTTHSRMLADIKLAYEPHLYEFVKKLG